MAHSPQIAILTPDQVDPQTESAWQARFDALSAALHSAGLSATAVPWTSEAELSAYALVLPLLAWGYHREPQRWRTQLHRWQRSGVRLQNSATVLQQNCDKHYLADFATAGASIVPTHFCERLTAAELDAAALAFAADTLVIKPTVSAGAFQTLRWQPAKQGSGDLLKSAELPQGACMIQPYLDSIASFGEVSMIYFSGKFSHAVIKRPRTGDFRVQTGFGGLTEAWTPTAEFFAAATRVLAAVPHDLAYARIDLIPLSDGRPALMELEATEPDLFLEYAADAPSNFARAIKRFVG